MGIATTNPVGRIEAITKKKAATPEFKSEKDIEKAGVLIALPALLECGLLSFLNTFNFKEGYYNLSSILLSLSFCFLLRVKSIEKISRETPGELGKSIGLDRIPEVKTLRTKIVELSANDQPKQWLGDLSKFWMLSSPELAGVLYIDGHENPYFGKNNKLPRKFISRLRLALRATTDYWVNDKIGQPFFSITRSINEGMIDVIKKDIVPRLKKDVPNQPTTEQLVNDKHLHKFMIVCDREVYSYDFFIDMWEERISVSTYNKYVKDKWDESEFREYEIQTQSGKPETIKLAERIILIQGKESEKLSQARANIKFGETPKGPQIKIGKKYSQKKKQLWIREVRKLTDKGHQTSIITSNYKLSIALIGTYMFARWCQENFFKYMMQNFGIDFLISYFQSEIDDTSKLINPQYRTIDKKVRSTNTKLQKLRAKFAEFILEGEIQESKMEEYQNKKSLLQEDISIFLIELNQLKKERSEIPRKIMFKELEEDEKFKAVYSDRKHFVDTIKLISYRAETALANTIKKYMAKPTEARALITQIFKTDADFNVDNENEILEVNIHYLSTNRDNKALEKLCVDLNETRTVFPCSNLRMVYKLVSK